MATASLHFQSVSEDDVHAENVLNRQVDLYLLQANKIIYIHYYQFICTAQVS